MIRLPFSKMLIHCIMSILTSLFLRSSSTRWRQKETILGLIFSKIELYKIHSRNEMLKHLELRHRTHRGGWKNKRRDLIWWARIPRLERWWMVSRWRGNNCLGPVMGHLGKGDSLDCSQKNYFWSIDHWNSSYQLKAIFNWSFERARRNGILGLGWMMWTTLLETTQWMICLSSETDGTHGKSTFEDDPGQLLLRCKLGTKCKCWEWFW